MHLQQASVLRQYALIKMTYVSLAMNNAYKVLLVGNSSFCDLRAAWYLAKDCLGDDHCMCAVARLSKPDFRSWN